MIKNIIFDLDGTLVDTAPDILLCLKKAYKICDLKIVGKMDKYIIGPPISEIVGKLSPDISKHQIDKVVSAYRLCYDNFAYPNTKAYYKDIVSFLEKMTKKGCQFFIATNKPTISSKQILRRLKLIKYFNNIYCPDTFSGRWLTKTAMVSLVIKQGKFNPAETIFIGDSVLDIMAGQENNISVLAVASGYTKKSDLAKACPDLLAKNHDQMIKLLVDLIRF